MKPFDYAAARQAGYSDEEIGRFLAQQSSFDFDSAIDQGYSPEEIVGFLSSRSSEAPKEEERPGLLSSIGRVFKQGAEQAMASYEVGPQVISGGVEGTEGPIVSSLTQESFQPPELEAAKTAFQDEGEMWRKAEAWTPQVIEPLARAAVEMGRQIMLNPKGALYFAAEQAANMVPSIIGGTGGGLAGGAVAGPVGAGVGVVSGSFAASAPMEIGAEFIGIVGNELVSRGLSATEPNVKMLLQDQAFRDEAVQQARIKGITVAGVDAAVSVLGGRIASAPGRRAVIDAIRESAETGAEVQSLVRRNLDQLPVSEKLVAGAKGYGVDVVGAGVGEAAGQLAAYGETDLEGFMLEAFGEMGGAVAEVPALGRTFVSAAKKASISQPAPVNPQQTPITPQQELSAEERLNTAANAADAVQAAADLVGQDIEQMELEAGLVAPAPQTPVATASEGLVARAMAEQEQAAAEPQLTVDTLMAADISAMPAPEREEFLSDLTAARTANLPEQRQQALARAAETYGRTVGPVQQIAPRVAPQEAAARAQALPERQPQTEAPSLEALNQADTRGMSVEDREDFNAQLAMARTNAPGPVQTAALTRAAEIYGSTLGPLQTRTEAQPRAVEVPRPSKLQGKAAGLYTDEDLQSLITNNDIPAVTRRGAEIELQARRLEQQPPAQEVQNENFISVPEALPDAVADDDASARAAAQAKLDAYSQAEGIEQAVLFNEPPAELAEQVKAIADLVGSQWGGRVVAFADDRPDAINGVAVGKVAFVNVSTPQTGVANTSLHEFKHTVEQIAQAERAAGITDTPAQEFVDQIDSVFDDMTDEGKRAYAENFLFKEELDQLQGEAREARVQEILHSPMLRSEMTADFLGNRATDKKFWQDIAAADPTGFEGFVRKWLDTINNLLESLRGSKTKTESAKVDKYIRDLNRAKLTAQSALINYRKSTGAGAVAAEGEAQFSKATRGGRVEQAGEFTVRVQKDGSIGVQGDAEAIRAQLPDDVKGRQVEGGMVFTPSDAPRVRAALQGRKTAYSRGGEVVKALPVKDGKYVGAPQKYNTPAKIPTLRRNLRKLAKEGEAGRYWYENSGREVLKLVGGDVQEARKMIALLSIYSPQAKVDANSTFALRAWAQYKAGQPINVKTRVSDEKAQRAMDDVDAFWSGEKTGNFYTNLLREIDSGLPQGATIDLWMMRAGEYSSDAPSSNQYAFMENETNRLAQELGWEPQQVQAAIWVAMKARMENAGVKKRTEASSEKKGWIKYTYPLKKGRPVKTRVVINAQAHRDNWLKHAFEHEPTASDTQAAKFDFSDGLRRHIGQLSWEARPGRTTGVLPGVNDAPFEQQVEFQQAVQKALLDDDGVDLLAYKMGLLVDGPDILAPGVWQGEVAAGMQKLVAMAPGFSSEKKIDSAQKAALDAYASVLGLLLRQEGIGYHRPFHKGRRQDENGVEVSIGRPMTAEEAAAFWQAVDARLPDGWENGAGLISSPNGMRVVNLGAMEDNLSFQKEIKAAAATLPVNSQVIYFSSDGDLITNDWKENPDGQSYRSRISAARSPDLLEWAGSVLAPRIQTVFEEYSAKYGWGDPGRTPLLDEPRFSRRDGRGRDQGGTVAPRAVPPLPGAPQVEGATGPDERLVSVARKYAENRGIDFRRQGAYAQVDEDRAKRLAQAYEEMPHAPNDPIVKAAYRDLIQQTTDQYRALTDAGYKFYFFDETNDPYQGNPWNAMRDLRANQVMGVFSTSAGFGSSDLDVSANPLLEDTGITWPVGSLDSQERAPVLANDLFRAVHDAFGHGLEGAGFRAQGEENAWQAHSRLFTGPALGALTSETRGQNSWLNYGPNGEANRNAKVEDTVFADQKTGLMPEWTWTEGVVADEDPSAADEFIAFSKRQKPAPKKTVTAYKLFRVDARRPGQLFPLFVNANDPVPFGEWQDADIGPLGEGGKVKSKLGLLAFRPGWHAGDLPIATHIGQKSDPSLRAPDVRSENQVWAEVELAADRDWQEVADERGKNAQGKIVAARAHITDQVPEDGFYRYKTSPNMVGKWLIGGSMKVNRLLSDAEVQQINAAAGAADLRREKPFDAKKYGFEKPKFSRAQTDTPEFKRWFGDSKAVIAVNTDTGRPATSSREPQRLVPQVMYHTTRNDFSEFEIGRTTVNSGTFGDWETSRAAVFVTPDLEASQAYGGVGGRFSEGAQVMPLYVKAETPLDLTSGVSEQDAQRLIEAGMSERFVYNRLGDWSMFDDTEGSENVELIKRAGYDSVIFNDQNPDTGESFEAYAVFSPTQLKSALGNRGTFDETLPQIQFSRAQKNAPRLYSALGRAVQAGPTRAPAQQWKGFLRNQKGVTPEEIEWSGVEDWLDLQTGAVARADLDAYLAQNGVQIGEVVKASPAAKPSVWEDPETGRRLTMDEWMDVFEENDVDAMEGMVGLEPINESAPQYAQWVEPGGMNYREILLTLPVTQEGPRYRSGHWRDDLNVLAHIRVNDRLDDEGNEVLFVEELQSDWAQEGRDRGFVVPPSQRKLRAEIETTATGTRWEVYEEGKPYSLFSTARIPFEKAREGEVLAAARDYLAEIHSLGASNFGVPAAPFVRSTNSWLSLALKRVVAMAVEEGYDKVAFVNGQQSADRYSLAKSVSLIVLDDNSRFFKGLMPYEAEFTLEGPVSSGVIRAFDRNAQLVFAEAIKSQEDVIRLLGKEAGNKLVNAEAVKESTDAGSVRRRTLRDDGLVVGGEGMRAFYDDIVPKALNKLLPKIGGDKVERVQVDFYRPGEGATGEEVMDDLGIPKSEQAEYWANLETDERNQLFEEFFSKRGPSVQEGAVGFTVTDKMKDQVMDVGMPLFSKRQNIFGRPIPAGGWSVQDSKLDDVIYKLQDKLIDTKRVVEGIAEARGQIADTWDPYLQETLYHGKTAKQTSEFIDKELQPLLATMERNKVTLAEIDEYLHNRHAEERNAAIAARNPKLPDAGSGIPTADARNYLAALPAGRRVVLEGLARKVDAITAQTRKILIDSGLENQDTINAWEGAYSKYVPLMREELDFDPSSKGAGVGQGFSVPGSSSKRATGSADRRVVDILANVAMQRERAIVRAERNRVAQALYGLAVQNPSPDFWLPVVPGGSKDPAAVASELMAMGINPIDAESIAKEPVQTYVDPRTGLVATRVNSYLAGSSNVVGLRVNGKDRYLILNPKNERAERMSQALKNLDADRLGAILSKVAIATRWFASVNTQYNPIFGVINFMRDVQGGMLNLSSTALAGKQKAVLANTLPALRGIYSGMRSGAGTGQWAQLWEEFQQAGGQTGFRDMFAQSEDRAKALQKEINSLSAGMARKSLTAIGDWLSDYNTSMENAVRLSAYKVALDNGVSKERAAALAKNLTVNFNKKGQVATQAGAMYAFFNAAVQGSTRLLETLAGPAGKKIMLGGLLLGSVQALMMAAAGFDEDEPPQFVRERNTVIPIGDGKYIAIPMPLGFNVIPNVGRIVTEWAMSGFEGTSKRAIDTAGIFFEMFNPIGNAGVSLQTIAPTVVDPAAAIFENRDWTGTPIAREDLNSLDPTPGYLRAKDTASWFSTQLSYFLNLASGGTDFAPGAISPTPDQLDYLIGQITGGVGREALKVEQTARSLATGEKLPPYKIPLAGRLYGETQGSAAESNRFYENIRRMNVHNNELQGRRKRKEPIGEYLRENPEARLATQAGRVYRQVQDLRRRKREMVARGSSRESIRMIEQQITNRMRSFNEKMQ